MAVRCAQSGGEGGRGLVRPAGARPARELQPKNPVDLAKDLHGPVLGLYGGADTGISQELVEKMRAALKAGSAGGA